MVRKTYQNVMFQSLVCRKHYNSSLFTCWRCLKAFGHFISTRRVSQQSHEEMPSWLAAIKGLIMSSKN